MELEEKHLFHCVLWKGSCRQLQFFPKGSFTGESAMKLESKMILLLEDNTDNEALTIRALKTNNVENKFSIVNDRTDV
jgi:hypothetical protein